MTLVVDLVRTVPSAKFFLLLLMQSLVRLSCHTHTEIFWDSQNTGKTINCGLTIIVSRFSLCRLRITTELRSGTVDKMGGIFTKRIWQPCLWE